MKNKFRKYVMILGVTGCAMFSSCSVNLGRDFYDAAVNGATISFSEAVNAVFDSFILPAPTN